MTSDNSKPLTRGRRWLLVAGIILIVWFPILFCIKLPNERIKYGPYTNEVTTRGIFEPGGYIQFDINPYWLSSLEGYYHATVTIEPLLDKVLLSKGVTWPLTQKELGRGWPWGSEIAKWQNTPIGGLSNVPFMLSISQNIPESSFLPGQTVSIEFRADIEYPFKVDEGHFTERTLYVHETFDFLMDNTGEQIPLIEQGWFIGFGLLYLVTLLWGVLLVIGVCNPKLLQPKRR